MSNAYHPFLSKRTRMKTTGSLLLLLLLTATSLVRHAQNPIIQTEYTADPAPLVYRGSLFLYTGHDEEDATGFKMFNWLLYTSTDM